MSEATGQRVHAPTPQRRQKARAAGQFAVSRDLVTATSLLVGVVGLFVVGTSLAGFFLELTVRQFRVDIAMSPLDSWSGQWQANMWQLMRIATPIAVAVVALPLLVHLIQTRFHVRVANLVPDFNRLGPRWQSASLAVDRGGRAGFALAKIFAVGLVVCVMLAARQSELMNLMHADIGQLGSGLFRHLIHIGLAMVVVLSGIAVVDYVVQRARHERELMMTTQELRDELREQNGDREIAGRRRAVQRQLAAQRSTAHDASASDDAS